MVSADQTITGPGAAYIFEKGRAGWPTTPTVTLRDPLGVFSDQFGWSVAISGTTIVVGALNVPSFTGSPGLGDAYIYEKGPNGWPTTPTAVLQNPVPPLPLEFENYGWSVAVSGTTVMVGAPDANAVYVYQKSAAGWPTSPTATLHDPVGVFGDGFGWSVAVSGKTAMVGALGTNRGAGAAYLYKKHARRWSTTPATSLQDPDRRTGRRVRPLGEPVGNDSGRWCERARLADPGDGVHLSTGRLGLAHGANCCLARSRGRQPIRLVGWRVRKVDRGQRTRRPDGSCLPICKGRFRLADDADHERVQPWT